METGLLRMCAVCSWKVTKFVKYPLGRTTNDLQGLVTSVAADFLIDVNALASSEVKKGDVCGLGACGLDSSESPVPMHVVFPLCVLQGAVLLTGVHLGQRSGACLDTTRLQVEGQASAG